METTYPDWSKPKMTKELIVTKEVPLEKIERFVFVQHDLQPGIDESLEKEYQANGWKHIEVESWANTPNPVKVESGPVTKSKIDTLRLYRHALDELWLSIKARTRLSKELMKKQWLLDESRKVTRFINNRIERLEWEAQRK